MKIPKLIGRTLVKYIVSSESENDAFALPADEFELSELCVIQISEPRIVSDVKTTF